MSVYEKVFDKLKENNIDVYPPAIHKGEVKSNYAVLKKTSKIRASTFSSQTVLIDVLCYAPGTRYTDLDDYVENVKSVLKEMFPQIVPTGNETEPFYDDTVKGWMSSVEYRYTVRSTHLK